MSTENGLERSGKARRNIERLRDRLHFLQDEVAAAIDLGERPNGYYEAEIAALLWALPVLEAEWDSIVRIRTNVGRVENQLKALERKGIPPSKTPDWDLP